MQIRFINNYFTLVSLLVSNFEWFFDFDILNAKKLHILDVDYIAILSKYKKVTWNDTVLVSNAYTND